MNVVPAYASAIISSVSFGLASVAEQKAAFEVGSLAGLNLKNFLSLSRRPYYLAGLGLDAIGYGAFVLAVRLLPLYFVQAVGTASILVTALAARIFLRSLLSKRAYIYIGLILFGLVLLAYATGPEVVIAVSPLARHMLLLAATMIAITAAITSKLAASRPRLMSMLSGLSFSAVAVLTHILQIPHNWLTLAYNPIILLIIANGILGIMLFSIALQHSSATIVYSVNFVVETIIPTVIGITLLGDTPLHHRWSLLGSGLLIVLLGTFLLTSIRGGLGTQPIKST